VYFKSGMVKILMISAGLLALCLGTLGIVLPGLPTTPFVLLAAGLFVRSSDSLYTRLLESRLYGKYLRSWIEKGGMSRRAKILAGLMMWSMIILSVTLMNQVWLRILVLLLGISGSIVMGMWVKTVSPPIPDDDRQ
jgi:uncharacterized protein